MNYSRIRFAVSATFFSLALCLLTGCLKNKVLVKVKPDGSGKIVYTRLFDGKMVKAYAHLMRGRGDGLINKHQIKGAESSLGEDVKYEDMKKLDIAGGEGFIAIYSFKNIADVKIPLREIVQDPGTITFGFEKLASGVAKLTVNMPVLEKQEASKNEKGNVPQNYSSHQLSPQDQRQVNMLKNIPGNPFNITDKETKESLMLKTFSGFTVKIEVETVGKILKSNAEFKNKKKTDRFTLLDINAKKLARSRKFLYDFAELSNHYNSSVLKMLMNCSEGFVYDNQEKINVEFK